WEQSCGVFQLRCFIRLQCELRRPASRECLREWDRRAGTTDTSNHAGRSSISPESYPADKREYRAVPARRPFHSSPRTLAERGIEQQALDARRAQGRGLTRASPQLSFAPFMLNWPCHSAPDDNSSGHTAMICEP